MKKLLIVFISLVALISSNSVSAITIDATITADNHYALYYGDASSVTFVGRNEVGYSGNPGIHNWSYPETWNFTMDNDDYIYVAAWSDDLVAQGWIGEFTTQSGATFFSNTTDWEVYLTNQDLDSNDAAPSASEIQAEISGNGVNWSQVTDYIDHGSGSWGTINGIHLDADWIWGSALQGGSAFGEYQIFRAKAPAPEPSAIFLFGISLLGVAGVSRRKIK